ncbi:geminin-like [Periplaneta americana]|uniref:geminin-like n=1 Tax=Periplaneta americana TaxID=6978 RepID=UPI0037E94CCE
MKPECSKLSKGAKNTRQSLQVLQPAATDKENLVGGSRQPTTSMKVGTKLREKCDKDVILEVRNVKKKKLACKSVQTEIKDHDEDVVQIDIKDLTSEEPSENYWKLLAEKRRIALDKCLEENRALHEEVEELKKEKERLEEMLEEAQNVVEVVKEMLGEKEQNDSDDDLESSE